MKIILSRKGFDSKYGKQPSPILPNGELLSFPIPAKGEQIKYSELRDKEKSYLQMIQELNPKTRIDNKYTCHLDPDIRRDSLRRENHWKGLFGPLSSAQGHLQNQTIKINDIFIFFGWYKQTEYVGSLLQYVSSAPDLHVIFGYLQIGKIYKQANEIPDYASYHSHANMFNLKNIKNNCIYEATEKLTFDNSYPGFGCLSFSDRNILTKKGMNRSCWNLPDIFKNVTITYHTNDSFKNSYFQSARIGQEFVIDADSEVINYFKTIICPNV